MTVLHQDIGDTLSHLGGDTSEAVRLRRWLVNPLIPVSGSRSRSAVRKLSSAGTLRLAGITYMVGGPYSFQQVLVIVDDDQISVADPETGEILIEHTQPAPGVTYVGNGRPRGPQPGADQTSPMS